MPPESLPIIALQGAPFERGLQHGRLLGADIERIVRAWTNHVAGGQLSPSANYLTDFRAQTDYRRAFLAQAPHLIEEIEGIAEGAGQPFESIFDLQLLDEEWTFRNRTRGFAPNHPHHCSAMAAHSDSGGVIVAQNFDGANWMEGYQRILYHYDPSSGLDALIFSLPGMLALNGVNRRGVAVCVNSLVQLDSNPHGLPVVGVIRSVLEASSHGEAAAKIAELRHASGQNYIVGDPSTFGGYETSGRSVTPISLAASQRTLCHTNHPLASKDDHAFAALSATLSEAQRRDRAANSLARLATLEHAFANADHVNVEAVQRALASRANDAHPLSRELTHQAVRGVIDYTVGCTIFELGDRPVAHIAAGPPSNTEFITIQFGDGSVSKLVEE